MNKKCCDGEPLRDMYKKCMRTSWRGPPKKNTIVVDLADMGRIVFLLRSISIQLVAPNCNNEVVNGTMEH